MHRAIKFHSLSVTSDKLFLHLEYKASFCRRANARNFSFETFYGGQFTISTQLIISNYPLAQSSELSMSPNFLEVSKKALKM